MREGRGRNEGHLRESHDIRPLVSRSRSVLIVLMLLCLSFVCVLDSNFWSPDPFEDGEKVSSLDVQSPSFTCSPRISYVGDVVTFYVNASSTIVGAMLNITIYFDYSLSDGSVNPESAYFSTDALAPAYITTTHSYDHIGNLSDGTGTYFRAYVFIKDGSVTPYEAPLRVYVFGNTAPSLLNKPASTIYPTYEVPYLVSFRVADYDNELVTATWDFGDGTEPAVNETVAAPETEGGTWIYQNHTWVVVLSPGRDSLNDLDKYYILFNMSVKFEDAYGHVIYFNNSVNITPPRNLPALPQLSAQSNTWSPGVELPIYAKVTDAEGDPLTWTYVIEESEEESIVEVYHTDYTEPQTTVWCNTSHTFMVAGTYSITLYVSDALEPWQIYNNASQMIEITVKENLAPGVLANITMSPPTPKINTTLGYVEVLFSIQAGDLDGDTLYFYWDFGDGEYATNESLGGKDPYTCYQLHRYTVAKQYNVSVVVDDNRGHTVLRYKVFNVLTTNSSPSLKAASLEMSHKLYAAPGTTVNLTVSLFDLEGDPVTVWINFGDNSSVVMVVLTEFSDNNTVTAKFSHVYNSTGKYDITITYRDGVFGHQNASLTLPIEIKVPRAVVSRVWNWWDYTSLSLVFLGAALVFARWSYLGRFRKELDKKGLSLEEYKTIIAEMKLEMKTSLKDLDSQVKANKLDPTRAKQMKAEIQEKHRHKLKELRAGTLASLMDGG